MRPRELVSVAVGDGLFSDKRAGKTPHQTMKSKLSVDVRRNGDRSDFVRTGPGLFYLRRLLDENQSEYKATPITKRRSAEAVLAFDADWFPPHDRFQGVSKKWRSLFRQLLKPGVCEYIPRLKAEHLDTHKQILTYVMVTRAGAVLAFKRGNYNRVEDYLRGSHCIGFGGHVSDADLSLFGASGMGVTDGAIRELHEELHLPNIDKRRLQIGDGLECVGVLNDDLSKVGQRHLAFIYRYEVSDDPRWISPLRGEKSITKLRWLSPRSFPLADLAF